MWKLTYFPKMIICLGLCMMFFLFDGFPPLVHGASILPKYLTEHKVKYFKQHEQVPIIANKIGPYNNPSEMYQYYSLPFCQKGEGGTISKRHRHGLGEILVGDRKVTTPYEITFGDSILFRELCTETLDEEDKIEYAEAIEDEYYFEFFVDDLPMWNYVGDTPDMEMAFLGKSFDRPRRYLFTHYHFSLGYNVDQIVSANISTSYNHKVDIMDPSIKEVKFTYSVDWHSEPHLNAENRILRYVDSRFLPSSFEIHWLSIINSFVLVLLLTAFLAISLTRMLRKDISKYMSLDEDDMIEEEVGWKLIHGDVFRFPKHINLFTAFLGTGTQLFFTTFVLLTCALIDVFKPTKRGSIPAALIVIYILTFFINGFVTSYFYRQFGGTRWAWNIVTGFLILPLPLCIVFSFLNSIAWSKQSSAALPALTITLIVLSFFLVAFPSAVLGGIMGRRYAKGFDAPCDTKKAARETPTDSPWFAHPFFQLLMAGFLPFSAIYIELHYLFNSLWGHKIYTLFGILYIACIMLFTVTAFITIALTYFQLGREDHRWWWRSFVNGGATGFFILAYSFYYFFQRSEMDGFFQISYFFGYMFLISYASFIMLGSIGFYSSLKFVKYIYQFVKID